jgi:hypothetical protein
MASCQCSYALIEIDKDIKKGPELASGPSVFIFL